MKLLEMTFIFRIIQRETNSNEEFKEPIYRKVFKLSIQKWKTKSRTSFSDCKMFLLTKHLNNSMSAMRLLTTLPYMY